MILVLSEMRESKDFVLLVISSLFVKKKKHKNNRRLGLILNSFKNQRRHPRLIAKHMPSKNHNMVWLFNLENTVILIGQNQLLFYNGSKQLVQYQPSHLTKDKIPNK